MTAAHQEGKFSIQYLKKSEVSTENKFQIELLTFCCFWMFYENRGCGRTSHLYNFVFSWVHWAAYIPNEAENIFGDKFLHLFLHPLR